MGEARGEALALRVGSAEALTLALPEGASTLALTEAVWLGLVLMVREGLGLGVALGEALGVPSPPPMEAVTVTVEVALGCTLWVEVVHCVLEMEALALTRGEREAVREALAQRDTLGVALGQREALPLRVPLDVAERQREGLSVPVALGDCEGSREALEVSVGVVDSEGEALALSQAVPCALELPLREALGLREAVGLCVPHSREPLALRVLLGLCVALREGLGECEAVWQAVAEREGQALREGPRLPVGLTEAELERKALRLLVGH